MFVGESNHGTSPRSARVEAFRVPPKLTSGGLTDEPGMDEIIDTSMPLVVTTAVGSDPYPTIESLSARFTPTGALEQGWVIDSAVAKYGGLNHGLILPVPFSFAKAHPGVAQAFVNIFQFSGTFQAPDLLRKDEFDGVGWPQYHQLRSGSGGWGFGI